jgi:hypothetical protein
MADDKPAYGYYPLVDFSQYEDKPETKATPVAAPQIDFSKYEEPSQSSQPSALSRFSESFTGTTTGLPGDITKWPKAILDTDKALTEGPLPSLDKDNGLLGTGGLLNPMGEISRRLLNSVINMSKNLATSSATATGKGISQFQQPGAVNKTAGALKTIIGGLPMVGPAIVNSMEQAENGNYAGMSGTLSGLGLQALLANPEASAARLDAAGKYLFSKPRVQEMILAGETKDMLTRAEAAARAKGHSLFPTYSDIAPVPGHFVDEIAQKALNDNIYGITPTPKPIADILNENPAKFKRLGAIEAPGGGLMDIFTRLGSGEPVSMDDLHNYYTKLGDYGAKDLPGDVYNAVKETRAGIGKLIEGQYQSAGPEPSFINSADGVPIPNPRAGANRVNQWEDAKAYWSDLHNHWWEPDSPLYQSLHAKDPTDILKPLTGDQAERATSYLNNYKGQGANPNAVKAAGTFYKGMNQFQLRAALQASGAYLMYRMLEGGGVPMAEATSLIPAMISGRLGLGYFRTRPSLTNLLSQAAEKPSSLTAPIAAAIPITHSDSKLDDTDIKLLGGLHGTLDPNLRLDISEALREYGH